MDSTTDVGTIGEKDQVEVEKDLVGILKNEGFKRNKELRYLKRTDQKTKETEYLFLDGITEGDTFPGTYYLLLSPQEEETFERQLTSLHKASESNIPKYAKIAIVFGGAALIGYLSIVHGRSFVAASGIIVAGIVGAEQAYDKWLSPLTKLEKAFKEEYLPQMQSSKKPLDPDVIKYVIVE